MKAFKVVRDTKFGFFSCWMNLGRVQVKYVPGQWSRPREDCGPLAAFDSLVSARKFIAACGGKQRWIIFECEAVRSRAKNELLWYPSSSPDGVSLVESGYPEGTILCCRIMLIKEVA